MKITAGEIAEELGGIVVGDEETELSGFAPASSAKEGDLTFAENAAYFGLAEKSAAAAVLVDRDDITSKKVLIQVPNARVAFAQVLSIFFPEPEFEAGVHPTALVSKTAQVDPSAHVGAYCVINESAVIGKNCVVEGSVHVGNNCILEDEVHIFPRVVIYPKTLIGKNTRIHSGSVIGADGFGYVFADGEHRKVPQVGNVVIGESVEIGAGVTIDRGAIGSTVIGKGTKVDNMVQIAHNVVIGEHCLLVSQVGIAGSTKLGDYVTLAGQVGLSGHLKIGNKAIVAAQSGVMNNIPDGEKWMGTPAEPDWNAKRRILASRQLPALIKRIRKLENRVESLDPEGSDNP
ncbi:MAG: UDP-3-O-(3-hydroxymyristoyl)glucosamine N-acyltransferase [Verrucomicrobia bacterium]|nr:UDP-3-O-(3-hydroxymyristoyl)glucosamine N-acyltransferase [Verrucomicrobiota bacterium]MCF7707742.1 UDP-3-O-(3-hydroxymyristoyl)glucosamine N-acyltransferase [Verrucomicrobiota bacterium]